MEPIDCKELEQRIAEEPSFSERMRLQQIWAAHCGYRAKDAPADANQPGSE